MTYFYLNINTPKKSFRELPCHAYCKPISTPVDTKAKLSGVSGNPYHDPTEYRNVAGAMQYLTFTRPGITYVVQQVCPDTRRSTSGCCVYLGDNLVSWSAKRQPILSRSSAEAEYHGVTNVVAESRWLRNLLLELQCPVTKATVVYCDHVSAVYFSGNLIQHQRTKHIEMDIQFVRDKVAKGQVRVLHVPSRYQIADVFTKGLPLQLFDDFRDSLNIRQPPISTTGCIKM